MTATPDDRKLFAWFVARAAVKGHTLVKVVDGFILAKGPHSKHCPDMQAVDALLKRLGA